MENKITKTGLELMREPFAANHISKLPKPTRAQTEAVKADFKAGVRCEICGGWHHPKVVHLDYVGHAALTDRLLECDDKWDWEPLSYSEDGSPLFDGIGGLWIKLTVCGVTRLGYGNPDGKTGGNAIKESIGDALRNAAMRFGAALDLWHKGDLHQDDEADNKPKDTGLGITSEDVPADQWIKERMANLGEFVKSKKPTQENFDKRTLKIENDPIFAILSAADRSEWRQTQASLQDELTERLGKEIS